jgi:hypothetical protein
LAFEVTRFSPVAMPLPLQQRVSALRRQVTQLQTWQAWGWTVGTSLGTLLLAGLVDATLRLRAWPLRLLLTAGVVAAVAWAVRRWLMPWWHSSLSDVQLARRLERLFPVLQEKLSSAVAFSQQAKDDPRDGSLELRYAVIAEAEGIATELPLEQALDRRPARHAWLAVTGLLVVAGSLLAWQPGNFGLAAVRLAWPLGGPAWPPQHRLQLLEVPTAVALGESFEVQVIDRNGKLPHDGVITLEFPESGRRSERHALQQRGDKLVFRVEQVLTSFRFRVTGGDDDSLPWLDLTVVQPPKLNDLITAVRPPAYSGLAPERGGRLTRMIAGSELSLEGKLDRPASAVRLQSAAGEPLPAVQQSADKLSFHTLTNPAQPWQPGKSQQVWIELVDESGEVTGRDGPLEIQILPDAPPTIAWDQPEDHSAFTPQAIVPIKATVKDDLGVQRVELRFAPIGSEAIQPQVMVLFEQAKPTARSLGDGDARPLAAAWDLAEVSAASSEGASISVQLAAVDFLGQQTLASPRRISLVSIQDMQHRLVQRQGAVLEHLGEILRLQRQARGLIAEVVARQQDEGKWQPSDLDVLQSADLQQRQVQRLLANPDDGLSKQLDLLLAELAANRLQDDGMATRMKELQEQVVRLNSDILPPLAEQLSSALKTARLRAEQASDGCADKGPLALDGVLKQQDLAVASLEGMLGELTQWDNFSRISRELGVLRQEQQRVRDLTEKVRIALAVAERTAEPMQAARQTAQRQLETARQFDKLQQRMETLLAKLRDGDPVAAGSLAEGLDEARRLAIGAQMRSAARQLQDSKAGQAVQTQDLVLAGLSDVLDRLASRSDQNTKRQLAALTAAAGELDALGRRSEQLSREASAAAQAPDPQQRQLQRLTKDAQRLAEEVAELARKLERLQAKPAAGNLQQAGQKLTGSGQAAGAGDGATAEQQAKSALADLKQARQQLQQKIQQAQEDLVREQLARLETELAGLVKRQQNLLSETQRLEGIRQQNMGQLARPQQASLRDLAEEQQQLAEAVRASSEAFESGDTFQLALVGVEQQMQRAQRGLARGQTDASVHAPQQQAVARLQQLLQASRSQASSLEDEQQPAGEQEPAQPGNGQPQVRSIGELQLLEQLQLEINRRTAELETAREQAGEFTAEQLTELEELAAEQGKLAEIVLKLVAQPAVESKEPANAPLPEAKPNSKQPAEPSKTLDDELLKDLK